jgi:hypothetical protein
MVGRRLDKMAEKFATLKRVKDHYEESLEYFKPAQIVGCYLQGSQNYSLELPTSDVDTKLIVVPSFRDIALAKKPVSTTHIRANDEHTDWKDIRLYMETFRKQNLNFLEILFTPYFVINDLYFIEWMRLVEAREEIAHMNPYRAVKSMQGIAKEKYHAMEHRYPAKAEIIDKYGYDGKQVHHLLRVEDYLERYIAGEPYEDCLVSKDAEYLKSIKNGRLTLDDARLCAKWSINNIDCMCEEYLKTCDHAINKEVDGLLNDVQYNIMRIAMEREFK